MAKKEENKEIAKAKFIMNESIQDIADSTGVSRRTINRWANENDKEWYRLRDARNNANSETKNNLILFEDRKKNRKISLNDLDRLEVKEVDIVNSCIANIYHAFIQANDRSKPALANALASLIELKLELQPPTVSEIVEAAIKLGVGPNEFLSELDKAWQAKQGIK